MLASDVNNPQFLGPTSENTGVRARFYSHPELQTFLSQQEGRPIYKDVDYVEIVVSGDKNTEIHTPVREDHKQRFPHEWANYMNGKMGDEQVQGTPLAQWPMVSAAQAMELKALKFFTVEQIAGASDAAISKLGMMAGMAPFAFRARAQAWLAASTDTALVQRQAQQIAEKDAQIADVTAQMAQLQAQMAALAAKIEAPPKNKGGRPRKVQPQDDQEAA